MRTILYAWARIVKCVCVCSLHSRSLARSSFWFSAVCLPFCLQAFVHSQFAWKSYTKSTRFLFPRVSVQELLWNLFSCFPNWCNRFLTHSVSPSLIPAQTSFGRELYYFLWFVLVFCCCRYCCSTSPTPHRPCTWLALSSSSRWM